MQLFLWEAGLAKVRGLALHNAGVAIEVVILEIILGELRVQLQQFFDCCARLVNLAEADIAARQQHVAV